MKTDTSTPARHVIPRIHLEAREKNNHYSLITSTPYRLHRVLRLRPPASKDESGGRSREYIYPNNPIQVSPKRFRRFTISSLA